MAGKAIYLSDNDAHILRELIARERQRYGGAPPLRSGDPPLIQAPEVYISSTTETNDPTTITPTEHFIQRILRNADDDGDEVVDAGFSKEEVYSPSSIIVRDKFGKWLLVGVGGAQIIQAVITAAAPTVWYDFVEGVTVFATVVEINCPSCDVAVGDTITIWDPRSCYFDLPIASLIGAIATAVKAVAPVAQPGDVPPETWLGSSCRWVAIGVSCCEEIYGCA